MPPTESPTNEILLHHATPIFRVANLSTSLDYYTRILGFSIPWQLPYYAAVRRGTCSIMLCEGGQGHPGTWLWAPCSDVDALYHELKIAGANLLQAPTNFPWGSREIQILDPDNHRLRFAADLKEGEPTGQFID
jgi:uncharacterized glyoxalase superfamily protein PhnB